MRALKLTPICLAALLAACAAPKPATPPAPPPPPPPPPPPHIGGPAAAQCNVTGPAIADGATGTLTMQVSNEGGYCAARVTTAAGTPFDTYLLPTPPRHGTAKITRYDAKTSLEYTPSIGYTGADSFTGQLIIKERPGYTTVNVNVTVTGPKPAVEAPKK